MQCSSIPTTQLRRHPLETKLPSPSGHHSRRHGYESMRLALLCPVVNYFLTGEASSSTSAVAGAAPSVCSPPPLNLPGLAHWQPLRPAPKGYEWRLPLGIRLRRGLFLELFQIHFLIHF